MMDRISTMTSITFGDHNQGLQVGNSHGPIYYNTSEQSETRPEPLSTVPFPHDPDFVGRDQILNRIHESSIQGSRIVLVGLGGVGKSRLAIEYCHRVRQQSPDTWVFWVHASNAARCEQSLRKIADRVKVPGRHDQNVNVFQLFANWLQDGKIGKWILVLDNVDDDELLRKPLTAQMDAQASTSRYTPTQPPLRYLLEISNGSIIVTSRNREVALEVAGHTKHLIDVQPMDMAEALDLMQHKLASPSSERADLAQLVGELEFMPLAIVQAASYINQRSPRCSAVQYLEKLRQNDRQATNLLNLEGTANYRDWEAKNSILLTWQISFDHIRQIRPSAADLLSLMSFFDWQGIPEELLRVEIIDRFGDIESSSSPGEAEDGFGEEDADSSSDCDDDADFESDITTLRDFSFIAISENDSMVFTMHRLVQLTVRTWLKTCGQEEKWKTYFIQNLFVIFPPEEFEYWDICRALFPHVKAAVSHQPNSNHCLQTWAALLHKGALFAMKQGNIPDSKEMLLKSRTQLIKDMGEDHEDLLNFNTLLAKVYQNEGLWEKAEQLFVQVIEAVKARFEPNHDYMAKMIGMLADMYVKQSRWDEAEQLLVEIVETCKAKLGVDNISTLACMHNLASVYSNRGRWEDAERLKVEVLEKRKTKLGVDHPLTVSSMASLALTYRCQKRWEEAERLDVQALEVRKKNTGVDDPSTLVSIDSLASKYASQDRWEEAESLYVQVFETSKTKLGLDHPRTIMTMGNLAFTYGKQHRWEEAERLFMQSIETSKLRFGVNHPFTLTLIGKLALIYKSQGRWEEAEPLYVQVFETSKTKLGVDHPITLDSMAYLALTYGSQCRWEEAEQLCMQFIERSELRHGADHPLALVMMGNLAFMYRQQGRLEEAEQLHVPNLERRKTKLGVDHPETLSCMSSLADLYKCQGRWEEAERLQVEVLEKNKTKLGVKHPWTTSSMLSLALTYRCQSRWEEAERLDVQALEMRKIGLGVDHPRTLALMSSLALTYEDQRRLEEAKSLYVEILERRRRTRGRDHPDTMNSMADLARTLKALGQDTAASLLMAGCISLRYQVLGHDHPDTISAMSILSRWDE